MIKHLSDLQSFTAIDTTIITELLHPKNDNIESTYSVAFGKIAPGCSSMPHRLVGHTEVYFFFNGKGHLFVEETKEKVREGSLAYVPNSALQHLENTGVDVLEFICIVSPPWRPESDQPEHLNN